MSSYIDPSSLLYNIIRAIPFVMIAVGIAVQAKISNRNGIIITSIGWALMMALWLWR